VSALGREHGCFGSAPSSAESGPVGRCDAMRCEAMRCDAMPNNQESKQKVSRLNFVVCLSSRASQVRSAPLSGSNYPHFPKSQRRVEERASGRARLLLQVNASRKQNAARFPRSNFESRGQGPLLLSPATPSSPFR
jgi:hypothetical protein